MTAPSLLATLKGWTQKRFQFLLCSLLFLFVVLPFWETSVTKDIITSVILLCGTYAVRSSKRVFMLCVFLLVLTLATTWSAHIAQPTLLRLLSHVFYFAFFATVSAVILSHVLRAQQVTAEIIIGAICVYLLVGVCWAAVFAILEMVQPGSFTGGGLRLSTTAGAVSPRTELSHFVYYSFVTLTTLGYGEITPRTRPARALAALEAISGQLYLAILIARLVGLHLLRADKPPCDDNGVTPLPPGQK